MSTHGAWINQVCSTFRMKSSGQKRNEAQLHTVVFARLENTLLSEISQGPDSLFCDSTLMTHPGEAVCRDRKQLVLPPAGWLEMEAVEGVGR